MPRARLRRTCTVVAFVASTQFGCHRPTARIEALRAALVSDELGPIQEVTTAYPPCGDAPAVVTPPGKPGPRDGGCLSEIAAAFGSQHGFTTTPPDHAAAATAALIVARDGRGDFLVHADDWLADIKASKGIGHDALRVAVARKMAEGAPTIGRKLEDEASAKAAMKAVAAAIPGACPTYWLLGSGVDPTTLSAELTADHAACVQRDLARREGPGKGYGAGTFRAVEGALALWRETERALRLGLPNADPHARSVLEKKLAIIEPATRKIETVRVDAAAPTMAIRQLGDLHAEAGVVLFKARDAGSDAALSPPSP